MEKEKSGREVVLAGEQQAPLKINNSPQSMAMIKVL